MANNVDICRFTPSNTGTGQGTPTFTNGSASISQTAHGYVANQPVFFPDTSGDTLPTNFAKYTLYYVIATGLAANTYQVSATVGGSAITAGSAGSGTHTASGGIQVGSVVTGYQTPANAGVSDGSPSTGKAYAYGIFDSGSVSESGICWFNSSGTMMSRMPLHSSPSGNAPVNYSASAQVAITAITQTIQAIPNFISGIKIANNGGTPNTKMDIVPSTGGGYATDDTNSVSIIVNSTLTVDCLTTGANGLDTGSLPTNGTVHFFVIMKLDGTVAGYASTSLTPTLPSGYFWKRCIGSMTTDGSAHLRAFTQTGRRIIYTTPVIEVAANTAIPSTSAITTTLIGIPTGKKVVANIEVGVQQTSGSFGVIFSSFDTADRAPFGISSFDGSLFVSAAISYLEGTFDILTNTSNAIRVRFSATTGAYAVYTIGFVDDLGMFG